MTADVREGFLLTPPRTFSWAPNGPFYVDDVAVTERVYDLAYRGRLAAARAAWLADCEEGKPLMKTFGHAILHIGVLLLASASMASAQLPDRHLTPGATRPVTLHAICTPGSAGAARAVSSATKRAVFARYHVTPRPGAYEVDHLISLELGGSNAVENLWPQPYHGALNAHDKDRLENQLHALVCKGTVPLAEAQHAIATDWVAALKTYGGSGGPR